MIREATIAWTVRRTSLGALLVAASRRGVCRIAFGASERELAALLGRELPFARLERDADGVGAFADAIEDAVEGRGEPLALPLDVAGSRFQRRVWEALRAIPRGETRSYGEVAAAIGAPRAVRAVANACGANPVAVAIPCHRVVASTGLGGYHWGVARKRTLLAREGARNAKGPAVALAEPPKKQRCMPSGGAPSRARGRRGRRAAAFPAPARSRSGS